ncbi:MULTISPECIES: (2Fe-2S)-binding protein [Burkholderia]|uniref:NAD(FAD)-dependent dehydrogenase n=1 Tax=Burkholderia mayonis TaxID=1385591 RepID=A0A1B4FJF0_9BURK|nr:MULTISPECIES: (2Fe-2S)-binding protein [Burkholderia]AOJ03814.1 NAD(FAD)-dependent dehydrogenase [Burkholderia mayonis]KVE42539.1 NAD(FAD)-dependent dehydrogenase [Burkholderia mayonis]KVE42653.1 NAD(FAD)-dependent dehydrogenase [Burkholderia sp. BDU5]
MKSRFVRLAETERRTVTFRIDGRKVDALEGDTLLVAMLCNTDRVRQSEFGPEVRAGFCLMGACQDCWVWTADGERVRACTTVVDASLDVVTRQPEAQWPNLV